jgi:hypothetical protein
MVTVVCMDNVMYSQSKVIASLQWQNPEGRNVMNVGNI